MPALSFKVSVADARDSGLTYDATPGDAASDDEIRAALRIFRDVSA
jgi:hypothetical protein